MMRSSALRIVEDDPRAIADEIVTLATRWKDGNSITVYWDNKDKVFLVAGIYCGELPAMEARPERYRLLGVYNWLADRRCVWGDIMTLKSELEPSIPSQLRNLADISRRVANEANG